MSPVVLQYHGISLRIFPNDHLPMHVHAYYGECIMIVRLSIQANGTIAYTLHKKDHYDVFPKAKEKELRKLISKYSNDIVLAWVRIHNQHQAIVTKKINKLKK